jgi:hypothetical protein
MATKEEEEEILRKLREENERANTVISTDDSDRVIMGQGTSESQSAYDITNNALQSGIGLRGPTDAQTLQFTEGQMTTPQEPAQLLPNNQQGPQSLSPQAVTENTMGLNMGLSGPSAAQALQFTEGQRADATGIDYGSQIQSMDYFDDFLPTEPNLAGAFSEQPRMVTNVDLMGNPLREQPSVEQIRFNSRPDRLASKELAESNAGFFRGLGQGLMDVVKDPIQAISDATGFYVDPIANYMAGAEGGLPKMAMDAIPNNINLPTLTKEKIAEAGLTGMEFVSGKDIAPGGYDFKAETLRSLGGSPANTLNNGMSMNQAAIMNALPSLQQGQAGSPQANFVNRMSSGQPLTDSEIASAREFASSKGFAFDPRTGYSTPSTVNQAVSGDSSMVMAQDAQGRMRPQSTYEQDSQARQMRIGGTGTLTGDSAAREARLMSQMRQPGESQTEADTRRAQSRTQGSVPRGQLKQSDIRDLAEGLGRYSSTGKKARALEIQQRYGLGQFQQKPGADKLAQATSTVDRMIKMGQLDESKKNAAIQKLVGLGSNVGEDGDKDGTGVIGSSEFDRVSAQLQEGGSLYNMGIRVDPSQVDPNTGAAMIYRETPGFIEGLKPGPRGREMVSPELTKQLLPYARSVKQPNERDFNASGMRVNSFAGSR